MNRFQRRAKIDENHKEKKREKRRDKGKDALEVSRTATVGQFLELLAQSGKLPLVQQRLTETVTPDMHPEMHPARLQKLLEAEDGEAMSRDLLAHHIHGFRGLQRIVCWEGRWKRAGASSQGKTQQRPAPATSSRFAAPATSSQRFQSAEQETSPLILRSDATTGTLRSVLDSRLGHDQYHRLVGRVADQYPGLHTVLFDSLQPDRALTDVMQQLSIGNITALGSLLRVPLAWEFSQPQQKAAAREEQAKSTPSITLSSGMTTEDLRSALQRALNTSYSTREEDRIWDNLRQTNYFLYTALFSYLEQHSPASEFLQRHGMTAARLGEILGITITEEETETAPAAVLSVPRTATGPMLQKRLHAHCRETSSLGFEAYAALNSRITSKAVRMWNALFSSDPRPFLDRLPEFQLTEPEFLELLKPIEVRFE